MNHLFHLARYIHSIKQFLHLANFIAQFIAQFQFGTIIEACTNPWLALRMEFSEICDNNHYHET